MAVIAMVMCSSMAEAQSADAPNFAVGDTWVRKGAQGTYEIKVVKVDDSSISSTGAYEDCRPCISIYDRNQVLQKVTDPDGKDIDLMRLGRATVFLGSAWKFFDWPLSVGKTWRIEAQAFARGYPNEYTVTSKVAAFEDVKTPAGTFKAFRIDREWVIHPKGNFQGDRFTTSSWFAPDVKAIVKSAGRGPAQWEMTSYTLK